MWFESYDLLFYCIQTLTMTFNIQHIYINTYTNIPRHEITLNVLFQDICKNYRMKMIMPNSSGISK